jgi:outer membrane lipoprotein-sorting protein
MMRNRTATRLWAVALGLACVWAAGCGSGDTGTPAPSGDQLARPARLWPEAPDPPEPSPGVKGSLTEGESTGTTAPPAEGTAPAPEGTGGTAEPAGGGSTTTEPSGTAPTGTGGAAGGAGLGALPAEVQQAAAALAAKTPAFQSVAFDITAKQAAAPAAGGPPMPGPPTSGHVEVMPPDKVRIEGIGEMNGQQSKMLMVINGPQTWIEVSDPGTGQPAQVLKMDLSAMPGAKTSGGPMPFASPKCDAVLAEMAKETPFQSVTDADLDGEACRMFEGKGAGGTTRVWFSTADGMVRRVQQLDADGNEASDVRVSNIEMNPSVAASQFEYTPPDGVPVMDMAELMKQMMQGMGEALQQGPGGGLPGAAP